jgi:hypothetical protein
MSYDVTVFDPSAAPADPDDYVDWIEGLDETDQLDPASDTATTLDAFLAHLKVQFPVFADSVDAVIVGPTLQMGMAFHLVDEVMPALLDLAVTARMGVEISSEGLMIRDPEALRRFARLGLDSVGDIEGVIYLD